MYKAMTLSCSLYQAARTQKRAPVVHPAVISCSLIAKAHTVNDDNTKQQWPGGRKQGQYK
jgi:hypothetical protein